MDNTDPISLGGFFENSKEDHLSPDLVKTCLKIAQAVGFDIGCSGLDIYYTHIFGNITPEVFKQSLDNAIISPPLGLSKASILYTSHSENSKDHIKDVLGKIGTIEMISVFKKLDSILCDEKNESKEVYRKYHNAKELMISIHDSLQNLKNIIEVADFLSRHDF